MQQSLYGKYLQAYLSKLTESKLTQAMEEHMFDGESAEQEQNESFESSDGNSYSTRQSRKWHSKSFD